MNVFSDDTAFFSYVTDAISFEDSTINERKNVDILAHLSSVCILKYLCHRTGNSLLLTVEFSEGETVRLLKSYIEKIIKQTLIFFVPFKSMKHTFCHIEKILPLDDPIPSLVCCQDFLYPFNHNISLVSSTVTPDVTIVNILVGKKDGKFTTGHVPLITPSFSSVSTIFQYMSYMMWLSKEEVEYIKKLPVCNCVSYKGILSLLNTRDNGEEIAVIYPALDIGEVVVGRQLNGSGTVEYAQGIVSARYMSLGALVYDISFNSQNKCWKKLSCIHVRRV